MKYKILFLSIFILFSCNNDNEKLDAIIKEYQNHEGYNYEDYPLGNFSEEYFKDEKEFAESLLLKLDDICLLYTSPSPRDRTRSRMPSSA